MMSINNRDQIKRKWKIFRNKINRQRNELFLQIDPSASILYRILEYYAQDFQNLTVSEIINSFPFEEHRKMLSKNTSPEIPGFVLSQLIRFQKEYGEDSLDILVKVSENYILLALKSKLVDNDKLPDSIRQCILNEYDRRNFIGLDYKKANLNNVN